MTPCRTSSVRFTDVQKICAIWRKAWSFSITCEIKDLGSKRLWGALSLRLGRSVFRSGFRFHFLGFWVCALLFTSSILPHLVFRSSYSGSGVMCQAFVRLLTLQIYSYAPSCTHYPPSRPGRIYLVLESF